MSRFFMPTAIAGMLIVVAGCTGNDNRERATAQGEVAPSTLSSAAAPAPALDDPTIVGIFDAANTADIETGSLAADVGSSREVRDYGAQLARDHKMVRQAGRDLAQRLGVTPTPQDAAAAAAHADLMSSLRAKRGTDFDRAFLAYEVKFHSDVLDAIDKTLLPAIDNPEVRALVVKFVPAFEAHLAVAKNLQQRLAAK